MSAESWRNSGLAASTARISRNVMPSTMVIRSRRTSPCSAWQAAASASYRDRPSTCRRAGSARCRSAARARQSASSSTSMSCLAGSLSRRPAPRSRPSRRNSSAPHRSAADAPRHTSVPSQEPQRASARGPHAQHEGLQRARTFGHFRKHCGQTGPMIIGTTSQTDRLNPPCLIDVARPRASRRLYGTSANELATALRAPVRATRVDTLGRSASTGPTRCAFLQSQLTNDVEQT